MTTRELFNRWFRTHKKVPVFNEDVDVVCKANQIMTEDGKSVEDKLKEIGTNEGGSGNAGDGILKLSLYGPGVEQDVDDGRGYDIIPDEEVTALATNFVLYSQVDAIFAAPEGTIIAIVESDNDGSNPKVTALGIKQNGANSNVCEIPCSFGVQEILLSKTRMSCLVVFANSEEEDGEK